MKYLQTEWKTRLPVVMLISIAISALLVGLELTDWAAQINQEGYSHGEGEGPSGPSVLMYILPFVKEVVLIGVPMALSLLVMKLFGRKKNTSKRRAKS
jgi:hypothetical protein